MLDEKDLQYLAEMEKRIDARMTEMAGEARRGAVHDMQVIIENTIMQMCIRDSLKICSGIRAGIRPLGRSEALRIRGVRFIRVIVLPAAEAALAAHRVSHAAHVGDRCV